MITKAEWGYLLMIWVICNSFFWLFGIELDTKTKIIMPQLITIALCLLMIAFKLMGVDG